MSGQLTATEGSVTAMSVANETSDVDAETDATVFGGTALGGGVQTRTGDIEAVSYGDIGAEPAFSAGHDLAVFGVGNVGGTFYAGHAVTYFGSDGNITGNITAGSGDNIWGDGLYGTICVNQPGITAWGTVSATFTAATAIGTIDAGGAVTADESAPSVGGIDQDDIALPGTLPVLGDVGQAAMGASVKAEVAQGQLLSSELAQEAAAVSQAVGAEQESAQQAYSMTLSEFASAKSAATSALSAADAQTQAILTKAAASDQTALTAAKAALAQTVTQILATALSSYNADETSLTACQAAVAKAQSTLSAAASNVAKVIGAMGAAQANALSGVSTTLAQGKITWEAQWANTMTELLGMVRKQNAIDNRYNFTGLSAVDVFLKAEAIVDQKLADAVFGLEKQVVDLANLGLSIAAVVSLGTITYHINITDWSDGLFAVESPEEHSASVLIGGTILFTLATLGVGEEVEAPTVLEEAEEAAAAGIEDAAGEGTSLCKNGVGCFVAGTEVVTAANADGTFSETPIQDVYVGEDVMSRNQFDPSTPAEEQFVTAVEQHTVYSTQVVTLRASNGSTESITATAAHPFYVEGEGFTPAGDLTAGEEVEDESGNYAVVVSSVAQADPDGVTVYNFTVVNDHTYFVSQGGDAVWVHNHCNGSTLLKSRLRGNAKATEVVNYLRQMNPSYIIREQVAIRTSLGLRFADIALQDGSDLYLIEVKSGGAIRTMAQGMKDALIDAGGGSVVGQYSNVFTNIGQMISLELTGL